MAVLTTAELSEEITKVIPTIYSQSSAITAAGASSVEYDTTILKGHNVGGAAVVGEGEVKPVSATAIQEHLVQKVTLAHFLVMTNQYLDTPEGRRDAGIYIEQAAQSLVQSSDIAVLHGTNPADGTEVDRFQDQAITPNATEVVQGADELADEAIYRGLVEGDFDNFVLLSKEGLHGIQYAQLNGVAKYQMASKNSAFPFWASEAQQFEVVGLNGFSAENKLKNDVLSINGDFAGVYRAFSPVSVQFFDQATIGGVNLAETNQVAYRIEQDVRFFNTNPSGFTVVSSGE